MEFMDKLISLFLDDYKDLSTIDEVHAVSKNVALAVEAYLNAFGERVVANSKMNN